MVIIQSVQLHTYGSEIVFGIWYIGYKRVGSRATKVPGLALKLMPDQN